MSAAHRVAKGVDNGAVRHAESGGSGCAATSAGSAPDRALGRAATVAGVVALILVHVRAKVAREEALQQATVLRKHATISQRYREFPCGT